MAMTTSDEDFLKSLFGVGSAQIEADPFAVLEAAAHAGEMDRQAQAQAQALALAQAEQDAGRIREAISARLVQAQAEHDDWSARRYKINREQVEFRGDGPSRQASMSIGGINESRRHHALIALSQEMRCLQQLRTAMKDAAGARTVLNNMRTLMTRAQAAHASGNWPNQTQEQLFEAMLLDDLKVRGPAGRGNITSNGLSRAVLAAMAAPQQDTQSQEDGAEPAIEAHRPRARA